MTLMCLSMQRRPKLFGLPSPCTEMLLHIAWVLRRTCSMAVGSAPEVRMKMMGVSAVVSGSMPSKVQGCPWVKAAPRLSPMYLWQPNSSLSSLITCIVHAYSDASIGAHSIGQRQLTAGLDHALFHSMPVLKYE